MTEIRITPAEASSRILAAVRDRTLTQSKWHGIDAEGRAIACLLGALHPGVSAAADCNGALMPEWMTYLTVSLFDGLPADQIYPMASRYGELIANWHRLTPTHWSALHGRYLIQSMDIAMAASRPISVGLPYWNQIETSYNDVRAAIKSGSVKEIARISAAAQVVENEITLMSLRDSNFSWTALWLARASLRIAMVIARPNRPVGTAAAVEAVAKTTEAAFEASVDDGAEAAEDAEFAAQITVEAAQQISNAAAATVRGMDSAGVSEIVKSARTGIYLRLFGFLLDQIEAELKSIGTT